MISKLKIQGLRAAAENAHIEKTLEAVARVEAVTMEPENGLAVVEHSGADEGELKRALAASGYAEVSVEGS